MELHNRLLVITFLVLTVSTAALGKKDDAPRCGNSEGATCCQAWGNTCINNNLTCCNGTCQAAAYDATNPEKACGSTAAPLPICPFNDLLVKTTKFNSANAWVMTVLATAVYPSTWALKDDDKLVGSAFATWVKPYGITNATFLEARNKVHEVDTEGVCMRDDEGNVFVVFRGTSSASDAGTDMDIIGSIVPEHNKMFGGKGVQLHDGFTDSYHYVRDETKKCVQEYMDHFASVRSSDLSNNVTNSTTHRPMLWVGGHSLGAALATLAATDFALMGYSPVVYTIGSPRVGDKDWQQLYDVDLKLKNQTYRLVNKNDPVPRVPVMTLGYRHVGTLVNVNATRGTCIVPAQETDCNPHCIVEEHYTDQYLNATYACMRHDDSVDLDKCPQEQLTSPINYDLLAADPAPGNGTASGTPAASSSAEAPALCIAQLSVLLLIAATMLQLLLTGHI